MKRVCLIMLAIIIILSYATPCFAAEDEVVRVAVIDYPNYIAMDANGTVSGYAYEYLMDIQKYTGWKYEFVRMTFADASNALQNGDIDLMAGNQYTDERALLWDYSKRDMGEGGTVLCTLLDDNRYAYNDYTAYEGMRIGVLTRSARRSQTEAKLAEYGVSASFYEYDSDAEAKTALINGDVDAIAMSTIRCELNYMIIARINSSQLFFCTNKQRPELKIAIDKAMEAIHLENPYYEMKLDEKYYGNVLIQYSLSAAERLYTETSGPITVAISTDMLPVEYYDDSLKQYRGIIPDTLELISKYTGLEFIYVPRGDVDTVNAQLRNGQVQVIASVVSDSVFNTPLDIKVSERFFDNSMMLVTRETNLLDAGFLGRMIIKTGYPLFDWVANERGYTNISYAESFEDCLSAVKNGNAEYTIIPFNSVAVLLDHAMYSELKSFSLPDASYAFGFGVSKYADPLLLSILNKALASISDEQHMQILVENISNAAGNVTVVEFVSLYQRQIVVAALIIIMLIISVVIVNMYNVKKLNKRLSAEVIRADESSNAKSTFLANMSHDIRTPMTAIINLTELSLDELDNPKLLKEDLGKIKVSSDFLMGLINDILDMSRIESGKMELKPSVYSHADFVRYMESISLPLSRQYGVNFTWDSGSTSVDIFIDIVRFNQIFYNLISNAIKFTPAGGNVTMSVQNNHIEDGVLYCDFYICDSGIGMSSDFQEKMFAPFERADSVTAYVGTGLGLTITKQIVELMHGTIQIESEVNKGTTVKLYLPMPLATEEQKKAAQGVAVPAEQQNVLCGENKAAPRILIAEDHVLNRDIIVRILEKKGYICNCAENGEQVLKKFSESETGYYNAIIMDIRMPVMDGLEATKAIRNLDRPDAKLIPIIAMSANAYDDDVKKSLEAGMNSHLSKPIESDLLYQTLAEYLTS